MSGCSDADTSQEKDLTTTTQSSSQPPAPSPSPSAPVATPSVSDSATEGNEGLLRAGETALTALDGVVTSIDDEDRGVSWQVDVTTADGTVNELDISADGKQVLRGPTPEQDDAEDRAKYRLRVADAKVDFREAVEIITGAAPGRITELELDSHNGKTVWEADVIGSSQTKTEVKIDASTGSVL